MHAGAISRRTDRFRSSAALLVLDVTLATPRPHALPAHMLGSTVSVPQTDRRSSWLFDVVTLSGLPGSGTTTAARLLARRTGFSYVNTGALFRELARERGVDLNEFGKIASRSPEVDRELDDRQVRRAREGLVVLEGRLSGHMVRRGGVPALTVWLNAPAEVRVGRVAKREHDHPDHALALTLEREEDERKRYLAFYGHDLYDLSGYDLVVDSSLFLPEAIVDTILTRLAAQGTS